MERYLCQLNEVGYGGEISLRLPGERYLERPSYPDERALAALCGEGAVSWASLDSIRLYPDMK